jgi:hypothetical protein
MEMRNARYPVLVVLTIATLTIDAAETREPLRGSKPAWEWTLSERLNSRLNPDEIRRRAEVHRAEMSETSNGDRRAQSNASPEEIFVVDGTRNPELFLPYELMNALLRGVGSDAAVRESIRKSYRSRIEQFGWDASEFWSKMDISTAGYAALIDAEAAIQDQLVERQTPSGRERLLAEQAALQRSICQRRAAILRAVRLAFDPGEFDRFLYTEIAPYLSVFAEIPKTSAAAELQQREEGCR